MFNGLMDSTQVQPQRQSSSRSLGGSTHRHRTEQDIATEKMQQWMGQNKEYNLHMHKYYKQRDVKRAQERGALQVSMIMNSQFLDN
jgi:hypothetical protein